MGLLYLKSTCFFSDLTNDVLHTQLITGNGD